MTKTADTTIRPFSAGYAITEFDLQHGEGETFQISPYRAEDIREWWFEDGGGGEVPVVLRAKNRHVVPEENKDDVEYPELRLPAHAGLQEGKASVLIPNKSHTRFLMGFDNE